MGFHGTPLKHRISFLGIPPKQALQPLLRISILFFLLGCSFGWKSSPDALVVGIENEIKNLDVRYANDANSANFGRLVFQTLVDFDETLNLKGDLALEFTQIVPGKEFKFRLPQNRKFHDGQLVTSKDVLYSFEQAAEPTSRIRSLFIDVDSFETPTSDSFIIRLKKPRPSFLYSDLPLVKIFPAHLGKDTAQFSKTPVGSGPYRYLKRKGRDLVLERWENYFLEPTKGPKKIILRTLEDPTTRFFGLVGGEADILLNALNPRKIKEALRNPNLKVLRGPGSTLQYLGLNFKHPILKSPKVRQALNISIDRTGLVKNKLFGLARPATGIMPWGNPYFSTKIQDIPFDLNRARQLLSEAGFPNGFEISIRCSNDKDTLSILQIISQNWSQIGVKIHLKTSEFSVFFSDVQKGQFEIFSLRLTALMDPDILSKIFHSREFPPGRNRVFYSNSKIDDLLDKAATEVNSHQRLKLYEQVQDILSQDLPFLPLWYPENVVVSVSQVMNFHLHPLGSWLPLIKAHKQ